MKMSLDYEQHIGSLSVAVDISAPTSPAFRAILPPDTDASTLAARLEADIHEAVTRHFGPLTDWSLDPLRVSLRAPAQVILTAEERKAESKAAEKRRQPTPEQQAARIAAAERALDEHPDNGKRGWWMAEDFRHAVLLADCSTAREAREKARASGKLIFTPDADDLRFMYADLPDVIEL